MSGGGVLYRIFGLNLKRSFTDKEAAFFVKVDFVNHVALVVLIDEEGRSVIAGGRRYIAVQPRSPLSWSTNIRGVASVGR